ncbi:MAG: hypothetical protein WCC22_00830 [Terriglobales bacterium]
MVYLKGILAGIAAVVVVAIASLFVMGAYLWLRRPANTGADFGAIGWDPISLTPSTTWFFIIGIFLVGFFWEFRRAARK